MRDSPPRRSGGAWVMVAVPAYNSYGYRHLWMFGKSIPDLHEEVKCCCCESDTITPMVYRLV